MKKMICFVIKHDSHGISHDTPVWLPEGDAPETNMDWIRAPWLDKPAEGILESKLIWAAVIFANLAYFFHSIGGNH